MKLLPSTLLILAAFGARSALAQGSNTPAAPSAAATAAAVTPAYGADPALVALRADWDLVRSRVIGIAEVVPEDKLDWRPTPDMPEVRTFRQMLIHLTQENYNFFGIVSGDRNFPNTQQTAAAATKTELVKNLRASYDWSAAKFDALTVAEAYALVPLRGGGRTGNAPRMQSIIDAIGDNMDHYGNLVVYVRLNGIVPPATAERGAGRGAAARGGTAPNGARGNAAPAARGN